MDWHYYAAIGLSWFKRHWDTAVALIFSGGAVWYTRRQWKEMKRAREDAAEAAKGQALAVRKSLEIAQRSADAAEKSAEASVKGILGGQRAYLIPDDITPDSMPYGDNSLVKCRVRIRNIGETAAFNVIMFNDIQNYVTDSEPRQGPKFYTENHLLSDATLFAPEASEKVPLSEDITLLNTLIVEFDDIFQDRWRSQWCHKIILRAKTFKVQLLPPLSYIRKVNNVTGAPDKPEPA